MATPVQLNPEQGTTAIADRASFEKLARRDDVPGALGVREVKFLILDLPGKPALYFANTNTFSYHFDFATEALGVRQTLTEFNGVTYFRDDRTNLAGTLLAHDGYRPPSGEPGVYALEFWPTDPVRAAHVATAYQLIRAAMPFAAARIAYHPSGQTQEANLIAEQQEFDRFGVPVILTGELFGDLAFTPLNLGEGYGTLRRVDPAVDGRPASIKDVAIFSTLPNDVSHVAGMITETPQTPLSHINLKAKQNDTPNAYIRGATTDPAISSLLGKLVRYAVTADGYQLRLATQSDVDAWLEKVRPAQPQRPKRDVHRTRVVELDQLRNADSVAYGAKAANLGELRGIFEPELVPSGYAIPFSHYHKFMALNGLYAEARKLVADRDFLADPEAREEMLETFREKRVRKADLPEDTAVAITELQAQFPAGRGIRCRSSTNNEDIEGFNGAGLYDSYTHRPDEGDLAKTVKQVWASLWNFRAFDEREFHRIDHFQAAMGVAVHHNFDDEVANGVAVTKNPYEPNWPGFYVNVQVGESLITNPDPNAVPEELLISAIGPNGKWETQFIRHSSLTPNGAEVLTAEQRDALRQALQTLHEHFRRVYRREDDPGFAMDVEFKIDLGGQLVIKQARPWVE